MLIFLFSSEAYIMKNIITAGEILHQGGVIAYPTEAVYGLGCDPLNQQAVMRLLALKKRAVSKGLILIAASLEQLQPYLLPIEESRMVQVVDTWPGAVTWLFPASNNVPEWIRGQHDTVAVRVTDHPLASALCYLFGGPIVSTSANIEGQPPAKNAEEVAAVFSQQLALILDGNIGGLSKPTQIRDAVTGQIVRD